MQKTSENKKDTVEKKETKTVKESKKDTKKTAKETVKKETKPKKKAAEKTVKADDKKVEKKSAKQEKKETKKTAVKTSKKAEEPKKTTVGKTTEKKEEKPAAPVMEVQKVEETSYKEKTEIVEAKVEQAENDPVPVLDKELFDFEERKKQDNRKAMILMTVCAVLLALFFWALFKNYNTPKSNSQYVVVPTKMKTMDLNDFDPFTEIQGTISIPGNWMISEEGPVVEVSEDKIRYVMSVLVSDNVPSDSYESIDKSLKENYGAELIDENVWKIIDEQPEATIIDYFHFFPEQERIVEVLFQDVEPAIAEQIHRTLDIK